MLARYIRVSVGAGGGAQGHVAAGVCQQAGLGERHDADRDLGGARADGAQGPAMADLQNVGAQGRGADGRPGLVRAGCHAPKRRPGLGVLTFGGPFRPPAPQAGQHTQKVNEPGFVSSISNIRKKSGECTAFSAEQRGVGNRKTYKLYRLTATVKGEGRRVTTESACARRSDEAFVYQVVDGLVSPCVGSDPFELGFDGRMHQALGGAGHGTRDADAWLSPSHPTFLHSTTLHEGEEDRDGFRTTRLGTRAVAGRRDPRCCWRPVQVHGMPQRYEENAAARSAGEGAQQARERDRGRLATTRRDSRWRRRRRDRLTSGRSREVT